MLDDAGLLILWRSNHLILISPGLFILLFLFSSLHRGWFHVQDFSSGAFYIFMFCCKCGNMSPPPASDFNSCCMHSLFHLSNYEQKYMPKSCSAIISLKACFSLYVYVPCSIRALFSPLHCFFLSPRRCN